MNSPTQSTVRPSAFIWPFHVVPTRVGPSDTGTIPTTPGVSAATCSGDQAILPDGVDRLLDHDGGGGNGHGRDVTRDPPGIRNESWYMARIFASDRGAKLAAGGG